jgi:hypothetical protein
LWDQRTAPAAGHPLAKAPCTAGREKRTAGACGSIEARISLTPFARFDVHPAEVYQSQARTTILSVAMQHANGIYSRPEWSSTEDSLPEDWRAVINETIARGQAAVSATEAAETEGKQNARSAKRRS